MTKALAESRAMKAQMLAENLAALDSDYYSQMVIDDAIDYLEATKKHYTEIAEKRHNIAEAMMVVGMMVALLAGSGIDVPDNKANIIVCVAGLVVSGVGTVLRKRD